MKDFSWAKVVAIVLITLYIAFFGITQLQHGLLTRVWDEPEQTMKYTKFIEYDGEASADDWSGYASVELTPEGKCVVKLTAIDVWGRESTVKNTYTITGEYGTKFYWAELWIARGRFASLPRIVKSKEKGAQLFYATLIPEDDSLEPINSVIWYADDVLYLDDEKFVRE